MSKINFEDIQDKFKTALAVKNDNAKDIIDAIKDNDLANKFTSIQKDKREIETIEDLEKYKKKLKSFFDEVYRIITAPGVNKFIEWLEDLDKKGIIKISNNISQILIDEYSNYDAQIKSILKNKRIVDAGNSLFENIKSSVRDNIVKRIQKLGNKKDEIKENLTDFIEELDDLFVKLSEIEELKYDNVKDFYTNNIEEKGNDDFKADIDEEADFYFDLIKQVVEKKDFLSTDQKIISLSNIVEHINNNIKDIKDSIEKSRTINVHNEEDTNISNLYNIFEKNLVFDTQKNNISGYLEDEISDTWNKIIKAYNVCKDFYNNYTEAKISKLKQNKDKWSSFPFANKIEQYVLTLSNITSDNPIKLIKTNDISKIKSSYTKVEKSINSLDENNPKDDIISYFSNISSDFENKKIEILKKLGIKNTEIDKLKQAVNEINNFLENIRSSDNLLDSLNEDFIDGIIESYNYITGEYRKAIENSDIKDDLDFLDRISEEGYVLTKEELEKKGEMLKHLLEYDLINIYLTKNI